MSSESIIALAAVLTSGVLGVASLGFNFWNSSSERRQRLKDRGEDNREWYRRTLFEKRLEAIQEGGRWLNKLYNAMYHPLADSRKAPIGEALEWYERNILYLHGEMPDKSPVARFLYNVEWSLMEEEPIPGEDQWVEALDFLKRKANELLEELKQ
jgi:hypothetical protein